MPNLHKKCVGFLDGMWADLAHFAMDFSNQAVITAGAPLANLNTERITRAAIAFNAFNRLILEAQATMTPVTDSPAYLGNSPLFGAPVSFLSDRPALANVCNQLRQIVGTNGAKRDAVDVICGASPERRGESTPTGRTGDATPAKRGETKRVRRGAVSNKPDTAPPPNTERGMFFLKDTSMNPKDIFPPCLNPMPCAKFTCKGLECTEPPGHCPHKHPRDVRNLEADCPNMIKAIANHFIRNNIGWFNYHHFKAADLEPAHKALLGDKKGKHGGNAPNNAYPPNSRRT
jgi:hypothetical protein